MAWPPGERPSVWIHPDPDIHKKYTPWQRSKAQAKYLGQEWELSFEDYCYHWTEDKWLCKGRGRNNLCLTRIDPEKPWSRDNVEVIVRQAQLKKSSKPNGYWREYHATRNRSNRQSQKNPT